MGTSPRTGLVTLPTQPELFNQSQLVLYRLLFISFRLFFTGHRHPETLEPRVEAPGTSEPRDIGTPCKRLSLTQHTSADLHIQPNQRCRTSSTRLREEHFFPARERLRDQRLSHAPVVAILSWTGRGHHVPALTVTSGGRGVGFDIHAWRRLTIAHSKRHLNPRASSFSCFSFFLLRLATPALRLGVISGSWLWLTVFSTTLRTQARPAIEFVSGKEGLRPFLTSYGYAFSLSTWPWTL